MKHTSGPWKTLRGVDDDDTRWIVVAAGADREYHIATIENGQPGDCLETEMATASLIAASPDLLQAAKATLEYWETTGFADCEKDCDCIVEATRAAIAKAEGHA